MKKLLIVFIILLFIPHITAQQSIQISTGYSFSNMQQFSQNIRFTIGMSGTKNPNRRGSILLSDDINIVTQYKYVKPELSSGQTYYRNVEGHNHLFNISYSYTWNIINANKSKLFLGPNVGVQSFYISENGEERLYNENTTRYYSQSKFNSDLIFNLGISLRYEQEIAHKDIFWFTSLKSVFSLANPLPGLKGNESNIISMMTVNIGIHFSFKKTKK